MNLMTDYRKRLQGLQPKPTENEKILEAIIGVGTYGRVYEAELEGRHVAVKQPHCLRNWKRECDIMKTLVHPNIAEFLACSEAGGDACMVLEFGGATLFKFLQDHETHPEISWARRLKIASNAAEAIEYLHCQKPPILHRDVKSENILFRTNGTAFLIDFGLSKLQTSSRGTKGIGSVNWMAPEMDDDDSYSSTPALDVYSFGMVLYELLTRKLPPKNQRFRPFEIPNVEGAPPDFIELLKACVNRNPENRPSMRDVVGRLKAMQLALEEKREGSLTQYEDTTSSASSASSLPRLSSVSRVSASSSTPLLQTPPNERRRETSNLFRKRRPKRMPKSRKKKGREEDGLEQGLLLSGTNRPITALFSVAEIPLRQEGKSSKGSENPSEAKEHTIAEIPGSSKALRPGEHQFSSSPRKRRRESEGEKPKKRERQKK